MELSEQLGQLGLTEVTFKHNLSKEALFHESIANDRGRTRLDGPYTEQKSFPTKLGVNGPLVFYTDPTCTGRPVNDTFAVAWPEVNDEVWWKDNLKPFDPDKYQGLLKRVVAHLNQRKIITLRAGRFRWFGPDLFGPLPVRRRVRGACDVRPQHVSQAG